MRSIFIGIPHAAHLPDRRERLAKLLPQLPVKPFLLTDQCAKNLIGPYLWRTAYESGADHAVFMDDDAIPCPHFAEVLPKVIAARPKDILCLFTMSIYAPVLWERGDRWHASTDLLVGVAYVIPRPLLPELIRFEKGIDKDDPNVMRTNHDAWVSGFALRSKLPVWHPLPALIDHPAPITDLLPKQSVIIEGDEVPPIASAFGNATPPATVAFGLPLKKHVHIRCARYCEGFESPAHMHVRPNPHTHHVRVANDPRTIDWSPTGKEEQLGDHYVRINSQPWEEQGTRALVVNNTTDEWRRTTGDGMFAYDNKPVKVPTPILRAFLAREAAAGRRVDMNARALPWPHGQPAFALARARGMGAP